MKLKTKEVKFKTPDGYPVHGSNLFCHVSPEYEGWHWYGCVGWLWDTAQKEFTGEGSGYRPQPPEGFISRDKFRLGVTGWVKEECYINAVNLINMFEKEVGMKPTTLFETQRVNCYLFEGKKDWIQSSFMISLFTNLVRLSYMIQPVSSLEEFKQEIKKHITPGYNWIIQYFGSNYDRLHIIMKRRRDLKWGKFPYDPRPNQSIHSYGIGALTSEQKQFYYEPAWKAVLEFREKVKNDLSKVV